MIPLDEVAMSPIGSNKALIFELSIRWSASEELDIENCE